MGVPFVILGISGSSMSVLVGGCEGDQLHITGAWSPSWQATDIKL